MENKKFLKTLIFDVRKRAVLLAPLLAGLALNGCGKDLQEDVPVIVIPEVVPSSAMPEEDARTQVLQDGPYGRISVSLPDGWDSDTFPVDSGSLHEGLYGIRIYPEDAVQGYIDIAYIERFGVCGTGLEEKTATIAGVSANIGTYDGHDYWDFIAFQEPMDGIVALTFSIEDLWDAHEEQIWTILDTLSFDTSIKEGSAFIYDPDSEIPEAGLSLSLEGITPTGATLVYDQYDADALTGGLQYGDAFAIEVLKEDAWMPVPVAISGDYGFHQVAYSIPAGERTEQELDWEWLYGTLPPGRYRIVKTIAAQKGTGAFTDHTVAAQFLLE